MTPQGRCWIRMLAGAALLLGGAVSAEVSATAEAFLSYLRQEVREGAHLRRRGVEIDLAAEPRNHVSQDGVDGVRQALRSQGRVVAWRSLAGRLEGDDPFLLMALEWSGEDPDSQGVEWAIPLPEAYQPMTWELDGSGDNTRCDLLLYDRRQCPESFAKAYGIDTIPRDRVEVPPGADLLRVRVLSRGGGGVMAAYPRIQSHAGGRRLVVPLGDRPADLRLLFTVERYRETDVRTLNRQDNRQSTIRFPGADLVAQFGLDASMALRREMENGEVGPVLSLGLSFEETIEQRGDLIAELRLEELEQGRSGMAEVQDARLVDAGVLGGRALYLGQRREASRGRIVLPASVRDRFVRDAFTLSAWVRLPWGQLDHHELVYWPYRRGAEGLAKPFTRDWGFLNGLGGLVVRVGRHDRHDTYELRGPVFIRDAMLVRPPGWQHVSLAVSGDSARLYLNGRLQNDTRLPGPMTLEALRNGGDLVLFDRFWGAVARLRLHDYALSERQIRLLMHADVPATLVRYPLGEVSDGVTPAIPRGDFPLDAWSWEARDFKPEGTFAAATGDAEVVERDGHPGLLFKDGHGVRVPPKALRDLGLSRVTVSFWWRSEVASGSLVHSPGHWKQGMNVKFRPNGFHGVVCANWQLPGVQVPLETHAWHHMIVSYDNREFRLYHNGELLKRGFHIPDHRLSMVDGLVVGDTPGMMVRDLRITTTLPDEQTLRSIRDARAAKPPPP